MQFTRQSLEQSGFVGWIPIPTIRESACPSSGGVYVVTYSGENAVTFAEQTCGGWFKRNDPTLSREALIANWVDNAEVIYIGKSDNLKRRLRDLADFGAGKPVAHWGGRLIWQVPYIDRLLVGWKETLGRVAVEVEAELMSQFRQVHGKPPFANDPHRMGL